ncbi:MAG: hypothetical protein P1P64_03100 [Treponemataceae bacterium]
MKKFYIKILNFVFFSLMFFSCAPVAQVMISGTGEVVLDLSVQPSENTQVLVKNTVGENSSLFDEQQIKANLKTEKIETLKFKTADSSSVAGTFKIPKDRVQASNLFEIDLENKKVKCHISKKSLSVLMKTFPDDIKEYLELFASPITTGENLSSAEYEALILSVYGPKIANELKTSFFKVIVNCPGVIESVKSEPEGRVRYFAGNSATLTIPLSYMLSLEKPLLITISYK